MKGWPWEGAVQQVFVEMLVTEGWVIDRLADTARRQHGIDVIASNGARHLAAEVKGFPSVGYADPKRMGERKRAKPNGQAKMAFGKAIHAALILHDKAPAWESLIVLPDYPRYRELAAETDASLTRAGIHVVMVAPDGTYHCQTWAPCGVVTVKAATTLLP